jgi:hypothetical protein
MYSNIVAIDGVIKNQLYIADNAIKYAKRGTNILTEGAQLDIAHELS